MFPSSDSAGNPLNRLSYLRSSPAFLASALRSPKAQFIVLDSLQPLCEKEDKESKSRHFVRLEWNQVEKYIGDADKVFAAVDGKDEEAVKKMAVIGQEGDKTVGDLSSDEKRSYFLNKVSLAPKSNHEGNADCEMFRQFLSSNFTSLPPPSHAFTSLPCSPLLYSSESMNEAHPILRNPCLYRNPPIPRLSKVTLPTAHRTGLSTSQSYPS